MHQDVRGNPVMKRKRYDERKIVRNDSDKIRNGGMKLYEYREYFGTG